jgi:hypothetical protein
MRGASVAASRPGGVDSRFAQRMIDDGPRPWEESSGAVAQGVGADRRRGRGRMAAAEKKDGVFSNSGVVIGGIIGVLLFFGWLGVPASNPVMMTVKLAFATVIFTFPAYFIYKFVDSLFTGRSLRIAVLGVVFVAICAVSFLFARAHYALQDEFASRFFEVSDGGYVMRESAGHLDLDHARAWSATDLTACIALEIRGINKPQNVGMLNATYRDIRENPDKYVAERGRCLDPSTARFVRTREVVGSLDGRLTVSLVRELYFEETFASLFSRVRFMGPPHRLVNEPSEANLFIENAKAGMGLYVIALAVLGNIFVGYAVALLRLLVSGADAEAD